MLAIACGNEDDDDLRNDPGFKPAFGRLPDSDSDLCSQPTVLRWKAPGLVRWPFLPIHVYDTATSRPVAVLLRTGTTPSGAEIRGLPKKLSARRGCYL